MYINVFLYFSRRWEGREKNKKKGFGVENTKRKIFLSGYYAGWRGL